MKLQELLSHLQELAPLHLAADWDNVGLLLGDADAKISCVMTCLTVTPPVVAEAIAEGADFIVTHHPILFRGAKQLTTASPEGHMILDLARARIGVYSAHTAFDNATGGINDMLASRLNLINIEPLKRCESKQLKIVVFTPEGDLGRVSNAMFVAGAGRIGQYNECSFRIPGTGTFFGTESTNPTVGQKGRREQVTELRLEVICPADRVESVVAAMRRAHSYEEPAFDIYPLRAIAGSFGEGRVGTLTKPLQLGKLAKLLEKALSTKQVQMVGNADKEVKRMAIVCGAGGEFLRDAIAASADVFLTGEMRFHDCLLAESHGISALLPGHYATERFGMEELAVRIQQKYSDLKVWASAQERDPIG